MFNDYILYIKIVNNFFVEKSLLLFDTPDTGYREGKAPGALVITSTVAAIANLFRACLLSPFLMVISPDKPVV